MKKELGIPIPAEALGREQSSPDRSEAPAPEPTLDSLGLTPEQTQIFNQLHRGGGRKAARPELLFESAGPLAPEDLADLGETNGRKKAGTVTLTKVRSVHHQMAMYIVQGYSNVEISAMLGVTAQRIALLKSDPAFQEVLEYYQEQNRDAGASIIERLQTISLLGLEEIQDRLLDEPELLSVPQITRLVEMALDRSGHAPGGRNQKEHTPLESGQLAEIKKLVEDNSKTEVVSRSEYLAKGED